MEAKPTIGQIRGALPGVELSNREDGCHCFRLDSLADVKITVRITGPHHYGDMGKLMVKGVLDWQVDQIDLYQMVDGARTMMALSGNFQEGDQRRIFNLEAPETAKMLMLVSQTSRKQQIPSGKTCKENGIVFFQQTDPVAARYGTEIMVTRRIGDTERFLESWAIESYDRMRHGEESFKDASQNARVYQKYLEGLIGAFRNFGYILEFEEYAVSVCHNQCTERFFLCRKTVTMLEERINSIAARQRYTYTELELDRIQHSKAIAMLCG